MSDFIQTASILIPEESASSLLLCSKRSLSSHSIIVSVIPRTSARSSYAIPAVVAIGLIAEPVIPLLLFLDLLTVVVPGFMLVPPTMMIASFSGLPSHRGYHDSGEKYRTDFHR